MAANTANRRVLVTDASGRERVQEINNDLGLRPGDKAGMVTRLVTQGVVDISSSGDIGLYGREEEGDRKLSRRGPVVPSSSARTASSSSAMPGRPNTASASSSSLSNYKAFHTAPRLSVKVLSSLQKQQEQQARREEASTIGRTLLDVLRVQLLSKGKGSAAGIIDLQRRFLLEGDSDGSKDLSYDEFHRAMLGCQLAFSDAQLLSLFQYFGNY